MSLTAAASVFPENLSMILDHGQTLQWYRLEGSGSSLNTDFLTQPVPTILNLTGGGLVIRSNISLFGVYFTLKCYIYDIY
jgi:hypothetical protein